MLAEASLSVLEQEEVLAGLLSCKPLRGRALTCTCRPVVVGGLTGGRWLTLFLVKDGRTGPMGITNMGGERTVQ